MLTIASQIRILGHLPIVWLCDQKSTETFLQNNPSGIARVTRWWIFLAQLKLTVKHIPGVKNELCDFLSRNNFNTKIQEDIELLAKSAFQKMDVQLDLCMQALNFLSWQASDYEKDPIFGRIWCKLSP